jgi:heat shock protein HslJ
LSPPFGFWIDATGRSIDRALDDTEWVLTLMRGRGLVEGSNLTLHFAEERVSGFGGCNSYGGEYRVADKGTIAIPEIEITLQLCESPQGIMEQEEAYVEALPDAATYRDSDAQLEIANAAGEVILLFAQKAQFPMDPDDFVGTEWKLLAF